MAIENLIATAKQRVADRDERRKRDAGTYNPKKFEHEAFIEVPAADFVKLMDAAKESEESREIIKGWRKNALPFAKSDNSITVMADHFLLVAGSPAPTPAGG